MCIYAGLSIGGINAEVVPHQYEFQIGHVAEGLIAEEAFPRNFKSAINHTKKQVEGIEAADHLCVARYILEKLAMSKGFKIVYDPKPFPLVNGSGAHINYSDCETRQGQSMSLRLKSLETHHNFNLEHFGTNQQRLTGKHETSNPSVFSVGCGTRDTTVRLPANQTQYLEYRLPAADMDPYVCTGMMFAEMTAAD